MVYEEMKKQAEKEILETCKYGSFKDLIKLRTEVVSELTSNKYWLMKIDESIKKRLRGDFYVQEA